MKNYLIDLIVASILLFGISSIQAQEADVRVISIVNPSQSNGIHIGDVIERKVVIEANLPYQLSKSTLPVKGVSQNAIELVDIQLESAKQGKKITQEVSMTKAM